MKTDIRNKLFSCQDDEIRRYCYITVDFATAASRNVVAITPQMICLPIMILLHDCSMTKDERSVL